VKKHKKTYINSKSPQISVVDTSLHHKQLREKIDLLVQEKLRQFEQEIRTTVEQYHDPKIPVSVFKTKASTLELIVKYLHEVEQRNFSDIAHLLQRDPRTIWHAYQRSMRRKVQLVVEKSELAVPVSLFAQRQFSPLEILVSYLHDQHQLSFAEIARRLALNPKTIWTVYQRYRKKIAPEKNKNAS